MRFRKAILTGLNGTVAPVLARRLRVDGVEVAGWDRQSVPVDDTRRGEAYVESVAPDLMVHLAMGAPDWAGHLAAWSARHGLRFLYVSSVSVFDGSRPGPFPPDKEPDAGDDYGRYKAECERRVRAENPEAYIARIGWQIGERPGGNHMVDFLYRQQQEQGRVAASDSWTPSCSFLEDTADGLWRLLNEFPPDIYNLEGNDGCSFFDIASGLNRRLDAGWKVEETDQPAVDIRMTDQRIQLAPVRARLG
jgi:dTDP-4-dehydrorhamnose reductase